jgi:NTP pyrophosphatase (non-canonical NTP hydrolase)
MHIKAFAGIVHQNAVDHGFYEFHPEGTRAAGLPIVDVNEKLMLVVGELAEAQEELRSGYSTNHTYYRTADGKPEGFGFELADALIRILDLAQALRIDIEALALEKHKFNVSRPHKHGRAF